MGSQLVVQMDRAAEGNVEAFKEHLGTKSGSQAVRTVVKLAAELLKASKTNADGRREILVRDQTKSGEPVYTKLVV